jgi:hypothetical protein
VVFRQVDVYVDSDSRLTSGLTHELARQLMAYTPDTPQADALTAANAVVQTLFPKIHSLRVQLLHDIRIVVHQMELASVPASAISSLYTWFGVQAYEWQSYLMDDGVTLGYKLSST